MARGSDEPVNLGADGLRFRSTQAQRRRSPEGRRYRGTPVRRFIGAQVPPLAWTEVPRNQWLSVPRYSGSSTQPAQSTWVRELFGPEAPRPLGTSGREFQGPFGRRYSCTSDRRSAGPSVRRYPGAAVLRPSGLSAFRPIVSPSRAGALYGATESARPGQPVQRPGCSRCDPQARTSKGPATDPGVRQGSKPARRTGQGGYSSPTGCGRPKAPLTLSDDERQKLQTWASITIELGSPLQKPVHSRSDSGNFPRTAFEV